MQYSWDLGDGTLLTTPDAVHSYATAGVYTVKMLVSSAGGCADSMKKTVSVYASPKADFHVLDICEKLQLPLFNTTVNNTNSTINYAWDFGNGYVSNVYTPQYAYPAKGTYNIKLSVSTAQCPATVDTKQATVVIGGPQGGINYPPLRAVLNFPLVLQARNIGGSVSWNPGINLDRTDSYTPTFRGFNDQLYTITIKDPVGCVTVDTQLVKTYKKIDIFVPTVFTPNGDGVNDLLRPLLMSFKEVHYFRIYNRWGNLLFEMKSDRPGWNGIYKGNPAESQILVWMIEAVDVDGVVHQQQGTTLLMR
jgi:gliding motility-associated-like protein